MRRSRPVLLSVALGCAASLALLAGPAGAQAGTSLPTSASDTGRGHAHTHGPDGLELDRGRRPGASVAAQPVDDQLTGGWSQADPLPVTTTDQPDAFGDLPQIHLVYLYPADLREPRTRFLSMFEADARAAQAFLQAKYGRSVRFDETASGRIDITTVKSKSRTSALGGRRQFSLVKDDLARAFPDSESPRKKYIAWLDAPSKYCGQGELYGDWHRDTGNWNDLRTTGVVYRPYDKADPDGGFCRGRTLLHELGHNLGALYGDAPHAFDGAHCNDDKNDVMCYAGNSAFDSALEPTSSAGEFDFGNDDYWDAGATPGSLNGGTEESGAHLEHLNWWTVNLSRFVCRPAAVDQLTASCADSSTVFPTVDEFRYHSGDETLEPTSVPTG